MFFATTPFVIGLQIVHNDASKCQAYVHELLCQWDLYFQFGSHIFCALFLCVLIATASFVMNTKLLCRDASHAVHMLKDYYITVIYVLSSVATFILFYFNIYVNSKFPVCPISLKFYPKVYLV